MSTIRVDNFGPSAGGTTYSARGIAKAWANVNCTGTPAARDSQNLSSITDIATGEFSFNFTNSFSAGDYSWAIGGQLNGTGNNDNGSYSTERSGGTNSFLTGSITMAVMSNVNTTQEDPLALTATLFGDLA